MANIEFWANFFSFFKSGSNPLFGFQAFGKADAPSSSYWLSTPHSHSLLWPCVHYKFN